MEIEFMLDWILQPLPWFIAGPLIGLTVPTLLILGNKPFGISSSLRHMCAACLPTKGSYFKYNWKGEMWNLFFVSGILIGGFIANTFIPNPNVIALNPETVNNLKVMGITDVQNLIPSQLFDWQNLWSINGLVFVAVGGFAVGFGTRYAGGCTSGHTIMGLSNLQWPSLIATLCFMIGGIVANWLLVPFVLGLK